MVGTVGGLPGRNVMLISGVVFGVRARFAALLVCSAIVLVIAPWPELRFIAFASTFAAVAGILAGPSLALDWDNHTFEQRVANFVDIMSLVESELVFVTGALHHNFYRDERVIAALKRLPADVAISVYHERPLDEEADEFLAQLRARKTKFKRIVEGRLRHGVVADRLHCKIEVHEGRDEDKDKRVLYFPFDRERAEAALFEIARWEDKGPAVAA